MRIPIKYTIIKTLAATFLLASASCRPSAPYRHAEGVIWNTVYHMTFDGDESLADSIRPVLERVGRSLSVFDPESLVSRLNASDSCKADSMLKDIYSLSARIHRQSGGMFDPTLSPLITAWGFGKGHKPTADTLRIDSLLALTGMGHTYIKDDVIHKDNRSISFNFSAIAKGYGCDAAAEMLKRNGVENFLVEIGGEIRCSGVNSKGRKWNISIDRPLKDLHGTRHASQEVITVSGCGVATSGNYRNFHNGTDGHSFGHTIDPFTGRPAKTDILSATVVAPTAAEADAYATACMAMGAGKAKEMLNRLDLPALLILEDFSTWASPEFKKSYGKMTIDTIIIVLLLLAVIALIAAMLIKNGNGKASAEAVREEYERRMTEMERRFTERDRQNAEASEARFKALAEESLRIQSNQIRRTNSEQMEALLSPMRQRLEEFNRACTDSYVAENAARKSLADQIERLMELNRTIGDEARNLTSALKNDSRQQGRWGEIILETMLEKAGLKRDINFSSQLTRDSSGNTLRDDDSGRGLRPDVVVFLPDDHCLIIDSKVSLNAYTDFCGTDDETNRQMAGKRHLESVRRHIKELADKQYQRMVKNSAEHVLMFIPNEGAYITAVGLDPDLWDYAYQRKVCIVAPAHLFSVMQLINQMWNSEQRNNNADNIAKLGGLLYDKFVGFANELQRIEKSLDDARNAYDACYRSLTRGGTSLVSRAERLRALGVKNAKILGEKIREESECSIQES